MNNKIPCGGFYLSDTLGVDENGKLGVNGGEPFKSLVTDGDGGVKWEDRLAYDDSRVVVDIEGIKMVMVSGEVPSWASGNVAVKYWLSKKMPNPLWCDQKILYSLTMEVFLLVLHFSLRPIILRSKALCSPKKAYILHLPFLLLLQEMRA